MPKKLQKQIDKIKKSIMDKNIPNDSIATFGKLNEIEHSLYRYNELSKAGLKNDAKTEKSKVANLVNNFNVTENGLVLKGGISNTRYVWVAEDGACDDCMELNGTEYEFKDDAPCPLHPNCKCSIEMVEDEEDEMCDCWEWLDQIEEMIGDAQSLQDEIETDMSDIETTESEYSGMDSDEIQYLLNNLVSLMDTYETMKNVLIDFVYNYITLLNVANDDNQGIDKYYHAKANCEASQRGDFASAFAEGLSGLKEIWDSYFYAKAKKISIQKALEDSAGDFEANKEGREKGKDCPTGTCGDILKHRLPKMD